MSVWGFLLERDNRLGLVGDDGRASTVGASNQSAGSVVGVAIAGSSLLSPVIELGELAGGNSHWIRLVSFRPVSRDGVVPVNLPLLAS